MRLSPISINIFTIIFSFVLIASFVKWLLNINQILALYRGCKIHRIKAAGAEFFVWSFLPFAKTMSRMVFTPEIGTAVSKRNV